MNRRYVAAVALALGFGITTAASRAQVALVVGSVRDRAGRPIAGAYVVALGAHGVVRARARTHADGTFAVAAAAVRRVRVTCRYCRTTTVAVLGTQPVIAIVQRYAALAQPAPDAGDLANLPYADVASALALRPFTLLQLSRDVYPGAQISDRGLMPGGGLVLDGGVPSYDPVAGLSPFIAIPAGYETAVRVDGAGDAFRYGDRAGGGTYALTPFGPAPLDTLLLGGTSSLRAQGGGDGVAVVAGASSDAQTSRQRADLAGTLALGAGQQLTYGAATEQLHAFGDPGGALADAQSVADLRWLIPRAGIAATAAIDRGAYLAGVSDYALSSEWSDAQLTLGFRSPGRGTFFADAATRASSGYQDARALGGADLGANLSQSRLDVGIEAAAPGYDLRVGAAAFWIAQRGAVEAGPSATHASFVTPALRLRLGAARRWRARVDASGSYALPTFVDRYADAAPATLPYLRSTLTAATLTYDDLARVRASLEAARSDLSGDANGSIASFGLALTWQISPQIALRSWTMHVADDVSAPLGIYSAALAPTVDALWLTYANAGALRVDAIYRRDLLDDAPFYHVDGDLSGPLRGRLRWYAGIEDRRRARALSLGLRFAP